MLDNLLASLPAGLLFKKSAVPPKYSSPSKRCLSTSNGSQDSLPLGGLAPPGYEGRTGGTNADADTNDFLEPGMEFSVKCSQQIDFKTNYFAAEIDPPSSQLEALEPLLNSLYTIEDKPQLKTPEEWKTLLAESNWLDIFSEKYDVLFSLQNLPKKCRSETWRKIAKTEELQKKYADFNYFEMRQKPSPRDTDIKKDVTRTIPSDRQFITHVGSDRLFNILRVYSHFDPEIGYTQGMNFIAANLLCYINPQNAHSDMKEFIFLNDDYERDAFWVLVFIMTEKKWRNMFLPGVPLNFEIKETFNRVFQEKLPSLSQHIYSFEECPYDSVFGPKFMTLFMYNAPMKLSAKIIDLFLYYGTAVLLAVLIRILHFSAKRILSITDGMTLMMFLRENMLRAFYDETTFGELILPYFDPKEYDDVEKSPKSASKDFDFDLEK